MFELDIYVKSIVIWVCLDRFTAVIDLSWLSQAVDGKQEGEEGGRGGRGKERKMWLEEMEEGRGGGETERDRREGWGRRERRRV